MTYCSYIKCTLRYYTAFVQICSLPYPGRGRGENSFIHSFIYLFIHSFIHPEAASLVLDRPFSPRPHPPPRRGEGKGDRKWSRLASVGGEEPRHTWEKTNSRGKLSGKPVCVLGSSWEGGHWFGTDRLICFAQIACLLCSGSCRTMAVAYPGIRKRGKPKGAAPGQGCTLPRGATCHVFVCAAGNRCLSKIICYNRVGVLRTAQLRSTGFQSSYPIHLLRFCPVAALSVLPFVQSFRRLLSGP